jgi:hypothetical protein
MKKRGCHSFREKEIGLPSLEDRNGKSLLLVKLDRESSVLLKSEANQRSFSAKLKEENRKTRGHDQTKHLIVRRVFDLLPFTRFLFDPSAWSIDLRSIDATTFISFAHQRS